MYLSFVFKFMFTFLEENVHSFISASNIHLQLERLFKLLILIYRP